MPPAAPKGTTSLSPEYVYNGNSTRLAASQSLLGPVFTTDPVMNFFCHPLPPSKSADWIQSFIRKCLHSASLSSARFDEGWTSASPRKLSDPSSPPACSAVWMPPGREPTGTLSMLRAGIISVAFEIGVGGLRRLFSANGYVPQAEAVKRLGLVRDGVEVKDYWYLFFVGTDEGQRGRGLASEVIRNFQRERVEVGDRVPVWLEATTEGSMRLYEHLGFETQGDFVLGKGEVDAEGRRKAGGDGVRVWGMIWWPDGKLG